MNSEVIVTIYIIALLTFVGMILWTLRFELRKAYVRRKRAKCYEVISLGVTGNDKDLSNL